MKKILFLFAILAVFFIAAPTTRAFDFSFIPSAAGHKLVPAEETRQDNLVALFFETVTIDGKVEGDVIAAAENVTIRGEISGDLVATADTVNIEGRIRGSVWTAANKVTISGQVDGNVYVLTYETLVSASGKIGQSIKVVGEKAVLDGAIGWQADISANEAIIKGMIGRDAVVSVPYGDNLKVEETAKISGRLIVEAKTPAKIQAGAIQGGVIFEPRRDTVNLGNLIFGFFLKYAGLILLGLVFLHLFPGMMAEVARRSMEMRPRVFLQGLLALIVLPIISLVLAFTVVGLSVAIALFVVWLFFIYTAPIFLGIAVGAFLLKYRVSPLISLLLGTALILVLSMIQIFGPAFRLLVAVMALGAWIETYRIKTHIIKTHQHAPAKSNRV